MKRFSKRFRPDHLAGQLAIIILTAIVLFHATLAIVFHLLNVGPQFPLMGPIEFTASYVLAIDLAPISERPKILSDLTRVTPWATFTFQDDRPDPAASKEHPPELDVLRAHLWPQAEVYMASTPGKSNARAVAISLRKGAYVVVSEPHFPPSGVLAPPPAPNGYPPREPYFGRSPKELPNGPPPESLNEFPPAPELLGSFLGPPFPGSPPTFVLIGSALFFFLCEAILTIWISNAVISPLVKLVKQAERFPK